MADEQRLRVAIVNSAKCRPQDCNQECKKNCPVVMMGKLCIVVGKKDKIAAISEILCNPKCNICTKKCPFGAIEMVNIPNGKELNSETSHRYGNNSFKLHRLPTPRLGQVLGLIGRNGTGKSTALKILAGKIKPNLGDYQNPPEWDQIITHFRGSELQNYLTKIQTGKLKVSIKPQYVDSLQRKIKGETKISTLLDKYSQRGKEAFNYVLTILDLQELYAEGRDIQFLSGGELQRFAIAAICIQKSDVYMFDEPSSYLDVQQRMNAAECIRSLIGPETYVICVEHDLALLDYLSDSICCLYGIPSVYGVVTLPYSAREGINVYLQGYLPAENMRFRNTELTFQISTYAKETVNTLDNSKKKKQVVTYPEMIKTQGNFKLRVESGTIDKNQITVLLGKNGTGKTTFIKLLAGLMGPDSSEKLLPQLNVSYKPQKLNPSFKGTVRDLLYKKLGNSYMNSQFQSDVFKPMCIDELLNLEVKQLSGGELQRVGIILCLGKAAEIYLIDEPSAYLDSEQRIIAAKVIKQFIMHSRKTAFVVEHDFIMATYLADRVIYYDGTPGIETVAHSPESLLSGLNKFLSQLNITFRRDPNNWRPRINKMGSNKDVEQKASGNYFFMENV